MVNTWDFTGYHDDAEQELAVGIAHRIRQDRQRKYDQEKSNELETAERE